jgi:hypothetical protein
VTTPTCAVPDCGRPAPNAYLCPRCTDRLEKLLAELPADLRELEVTVTRQANAGRPEQTKRRKPGTTVLYDPDEPASKVAMQAHNGLSTIVRHLCEQRGLTPPYLMTAPAMAIWLTRNAAAIAQDELAGDIHDRMHELRRAIRRAIDNLAKRWAGPCTARLVIADIVAFDTGLAFGAVERECGADLRTRPGAKVITCDACGAEYDPIKRLKWVLAKSREHHETAGRCAEVLTQAGYHITEKQIMTLKARGKLFAYRDSTAEFDQQGRPRPLFLIGDLLDLLDHAERRVGA